jgi:very-short-patch-repair endonuclease
VVSRAQLLQIGLSPRAIQRRLERGALHLLYLGVYAVGHRLVSKRGRWMAAVLAAGPPAVLSHRSAAALWDLGADPARWVEVTAPGGCRRPGIKGHIRILAPDEVTSRDAIPVTTAARTLLDLASVLDEHQLERAVERAEALRLADHTPLDALVTRNFGRPGTPALRGALRRGIEPALTRSELEARFLTFLDAHRLPRPDVNELVEGFEVDCVWPAAKLIVELDSRTWHATAAAFERDRERDRALQVKGWRVIRITWRQLRDDSDAIARDLRDVMQLCDWH